MSWQPNLQILANAGSGKTHTLITRIIHLLVLGVEPRRIIALSFTRKAAGEFLSKLLQRLAAAAIDPQAATELSKAIQLQRDMADFLILLREVLQDLGRLQLTTLDSFFNRIVAAFHQELGLSGVPSLLDVHAEKRLGKNALRHALGKLEKSEMALLLQALFERDEGSVPRSVSNDLSDFRKEVHNEFLDYPDLKHGVILNGSGELLRIIGDPYPLMSFKSVGDIVKREGGSPYFSDKALTAWHQLQSLTRGTKTNAVVGKIIAAFDLWKSGTGSFKYNKDTYEVSSEAAQAAAALVEHYLNECTEYRLREARAIHRLLSLYEKEYESEVRSRGLLSFSDVTRLLQPDASFLGIGSLNSEPSHLRLQLDERLDALFDHWLLDEFQDTSRGQYRALENILDEVISEGARGGERSFFCVGDIKQAIYGWRKGDSRLFDELYERYHRGHGIIRQPLNISWRSSKEILSTLNAIFENLDLTAPTLPEEVKQRWRRAWNPHQLTDKKVFLPGHFSWNTYDPKQDEDLQNQVILLLRTMQPQLKAGMTIALLVRTGNEATAWLETLRFAGIDALSESNPPVGRDNPVAVAIRSALSLSVHPGDRFALNHLSMEPLRRIFFPQNYPEQELSVLIKRTAELLAEGGFEAIIEWLLEKLAPLIQDNFSKSRAASLRRAAMKADTSGLSDVDDFLELLDDYEEQGRSAPHAVQIMTIHKSKGLEYDMVIIPLSGTQKALDSLRGMQIEAWQNLKGEPFLMKLPAEEIRNVPGNETFAAAAQKKRADTAFEELCVWYVALSRAKRALYIFTPEPKKLEEGKCPNFPQLLAAGLENQTAGDPNWFQTFHSQSPVKERDPLPSSISVPLRPPAMKKSLPSDDAHHILHGSQAFLENSAAALGSKIHALFESIDWLPTPLAASISQEVRELIQPCLSNLEMQQLFQKPNCHHTLWREQRFDLLLEGHWVSGCFDRVVIFRDTKGQPIHADLIDFKTDQGGREKLLLNYRAQMESYCQALSRILNLPAKKIRMILIHVRSSDPVIIL